MVDKNKLSALNGLVGFRNPINSAYAVIDATNQLSRSGYFVNDNSFAKIEYLYDNFDSESFTNVQFNSYLLKLQESAASIVVNQVFDQTTFIDRQLLFSNASNKIDVDVLPVGFVGYWLQPCKKKHVAFSIKRVLLDFAGTGSIKLLLFNTSKKQPVKTKTIQITTDHQEVSLDWIINNTDTTYSGEWYIGYINNNLTVMPYSRTWQGGSIISNITHLTINRVIVPNHTSETMFDLHNKTGNALSYGINLDISVYYDYTDLVLQNEMLFARCIYLQLVILFIEAYLNSTRSNRSQRISEQQSLRALIEVEGQNSDNAVKVLGLRPQLFGELKSLKKSIEQLKSDYLVKGLKCYTLK